MLMTEYETTVVVRPDISGDVIEATLDRVREAVKKSGGKLIAINHWGKKKLNYPIEKHTRGIYVHTQYLGTGGLVAEVERNLRISESVLRFLTIKVAGEVKPDEREEKAYVRPHYESYAEQADDDVLARDDRDRDDRREGRWSEGRGEGFEADGDEDESKGDDKGDDN
jgi:small subunit ribosomal protein S6